MHSLDCDIFFVLIRKWKEKPQMMQIVMSKFTRINWLLHENMFWSLWESFACCCIIFSWYFSGFFNEVFKPNLSENRSTKETKTKILVFMTGNKMSTVVCMEQRSFFLVLVLMQLVILSSCTIITGKCATMECIKSARSNILYGTHVDMLN